MATDAIRWQRSVTLGAASGDLSGARTVIDGFWLGMAKRSIEVA